MQNRSNGHSKTLVEARSQIPDTRSNLSPTPVPEAAREPLAENPTPPGWRPAGDFLPAMPAAGAAAMSNIELMNCVRPARDTGEPCVNGFLLNHTADRVMDAARLDPARWRGDNRPVIRWLADGFEPDHIVAAISGAASRTGYQPPFSLAWFDRAVREYQPRRRFVG